MFNRNTFIHSLFSTTSVDFNEKALALFHYQAQHNEVYKQYLHYLGRPFSHITHLHEIPFLPIRFFKTHHVQSGRWEPEIIFTSSSTTGTGLSRHRVQSSRLYRKSFINSFSLFLGSPDSYIICAVLPSYREREGSSLIYMVEELIRLSNHPLSGFYAADSALNNHLLQLEKEASSSGKTVLLWGVTFALLDITAHTSLQLPHTLIMETGGMKGRKKEMTRPELHGILREKLAPKGICSEYGMTELLSQAYILQNLYQCPPWMKIMIRNSNNPFEVNDLPGTSGAINVIDLANVDSCAFIATDDTGRIHENGFELNGRLDNSDIRGCSLLFA